MGLLIVLGVWGQGLRPVYAQDASEKQLSGLSTGLKSLMHRYGAPGLAVAAIVDGKIVFSEGFGHENIKGDRPITAESLFGIGSIVKTFTSALIGTLLDDGLINLGGRPGDYIAGLAFGDAGLERDLRIRNLLSQTSGLSEMVGSYVVFPESTQVLLAPRFAHFGSTCRVGDCWAYNNVNFVLLDMVAESLTKQSKSELLMKRLLAPAGMSHSVTSTASFLASPHAATGYGLVGEQMVPVAYEEFFGEHVYATAPDMARWLALWSNRGVVGGRQVISETYVRQALSMQAIDDGAPPSPDDAHVYLFGYGYGWHVKSMDGYYTVSHGGNENGFSAHVLYSPSKRVGVVALTNQQNSLLPNIVTDHVIHRLLNLPAKDLASYPIRVGQVDPILSAQDARLSILRDDPLTVSPLALVGVYQAPGYGVLHVAFTDGHLTLTTPLAKFALRHDGGNRFRLGVTAPLPAGMNVSFFVATFKESEKGGESISINLSPTPVIFTRIARR